MTEPVTRRTIRCNRYLCEEGYDSDCGIGPLFYSVADEEDIEYYTEEVIYSLVKFQVSMAPDLKANIYVSSPTVETEEPLMAEKAQKLKVSELKV